MNKLCMLFVFLLFPVGNDVSHAEHFLLDEPEIERHVSVTRQGIKSYAQALRTWKTAQDINQWVASSFTYDRARAIQLSSNQRTKNKAISIYEPSRFFETKTGVCVDLARFGVETLRIIYPDTDPRYLMIQFEPIRINGNTFRLHWLVSFTEDGMKYFFCDSKRPGYMAGPYNSTQAFINAYEKYRGRKIVSYRELESYKKKKRLKSAKKRDTKGPSKSNP